MIPNHPLRPPLAIAAALLLALSLAGCGTKHEAQPDIGAGGDAYKLSPCACLVVPQHYPPGWLERAVGG